MSTANITAEERLSFQRFSNIFLVKDTPQCIKEAIVICSSLKATQNRNGVESRSQTCARALFFRARLLLALFGAVKMFYRLGSPKSWISQMKSRKTINYWWKRNLRFGPFLSTFCMFEACFDTNRQHTALKSSRNMTFVS